nr:hypothetical protein [uncultured Sphingomonas sp.]
MIRADVSVRYARHDSDDIAIVDMIRSRTVLLSMPGCIDDQKHLRDVIEDVAVDILNDTASTDTVVAGGRYRAVEGWAADDDGIIRRCMIVEDTMPPMTDSGDPAFGEILRSPASDDDAAHLDALRITTIVATGLNRIDFDWHAYSNKSDDAVKAHPTWKPTLAMA